MVANFVSVEKGSLASDGPVSLARIYLKKNVIHDNNIEYYGLSKTKILIVVLVANFSS